MASDAAPPASKSLLIVVGMKAEARIAAGASMIVGGGDSVALARRLESALSDGATAVISFGVAGGLDPALKPGDIVIGQAVHAEGGRLETDASWLAALAKALPRATTADVAGGDRMLATITDKAALRERCGAAIVDLESHLAASLARRHGLPFAVMRAVSDPASSALPRAALAGLKPNGEADVAGVLRALARRPRELGALIRTAREAGAAMGALRDARHLLGPGLACPYLGQHLLDMA